MVEILGVWTKSLEIEQSYGLVHKEKAKALVLVIEEEGVPWYYDIMKFLELEVYLDGANKREHRSIRMEAMNTSYAKVSSIGYPMMVYIFTVQRKKKLRKSWRKCTRDLWSSYEWENVSQEDLEDRVLF